MPNDLNALWMMLFAMGPAAAQEGGHAGRPDISIEINLPAYPQLVPVPGYPVYYAPRLHSNYFFYDGMYWIYQDDSWYASSWYNGPWRLVAMDYVPFYLLRVPVRYYRQAPDYFRGWRVNSPPHWGEHWGNEWAQRHNGWDQWKRSAAPAPAPLPAYQQKYSGARYPGVAQQSALQEKNYHYQARNAAVRPLHQAQPMQAPAARPVALPAQPPAARQPKPVAAPQGSPVPPASRHSEPSPAVQTDVARAQSPARTHEKVEKAVPTQAVPQLRVLANQPVQQPRTPVTQPAPPQQTPVPHALPQQKPAAPQPIAQQKAPPVQQAKPQAQREVIQHQPPAAPTAQKAAPQPGPAAPAARHDIPPGQEKRGEKDEARGPDHQK